MTETLLTPGTMVAERYELKEYIGSGSFGEVWLARDTTLDLDIAIKIYISLDQNGQSEFKNEYRVAYGLSHENLLTPSYYDIWQHRPFLIMKFCSRGSAAAMAGDIDEPTIWQFIHDVAAGLKFLHGLPTPVIHQDIKPANILVDENSQFLITDFGISRKLRSTLRKQSKRSVGSGAISYMGPERFLAEPVAVKASDIWSLGVSIYELATGELPFMGQGGGMLNAGAELPNLDTAKFSKNLNDVMRACLAKETWERPTAEQLVTFADCILAGEKASWPKFAATKTDKGNSGKDKAEDGSSHKKNPSDKKAGHKKTWLFVTLAVIILAAAGSGAWWFLNHKQAAASVKKDQVAADTETMETFNAICTRLDANINKGTADKIALLVTARMQVDSLKSLIDDTPDAPGEATRKLQDLESKLNDIIDKSSQQWQAAAKDMYDLGEKNAALEYMQYAAALDRTGTVAGQLAAENIPVVVGNATINGNNMAINLMPTSAGAGNDLNLLYFITELRSDGETPAILEEGKFSLNLPAGKFVPVNVVLTKTLAPGNYQVTIRNEDNSFIANAEAR